MNYIGNRQIHVCLEGSTEPSLSVTVEWVLICGLRSLGYSDFTIEDIRTVLSDGVQVNEAKLMTDDNKTWS